MKENKTRKNKVFGLTGGIASGKSLAASFFAQEGFTVVDADQIAREIRSPGGPAHPAIVARFGTDDAAKIREKVFSDPLARKDLEAILHPLIQAESQKRIQASKQPVIYEATLLVETERYKTLDALIVVVAATDWRVTKIMERDQCSREMAEKILAAQITDQDRRKHATFVIENDGSEAHLREKVHALSRTLRHL